MEEIGSGSYGKVYKEVDAKGRTVAVKTFSLEEHENGGDEAAILLQLRGIRSFPRIYSTEMNDVGPCYIRMEYFPKTLSDVVLKFPVNRLAFFLKEMFIALRILHACYIIHADIKPSNILIKDLGLDISNESKVKPRIVLTDFSCSLRAYNKERSGNFELPLTTVPYRAHELAILDDSLDVGKCDSKIDVWSLGVVFFELIWEKDVYNQLWGNRKDIKAVREICINWMLDEVDRNQPLILFKVGEEGDRLLRLMLEKDPLARVSVKEALRDSYLANSKYYQESYKGELPTPRLLTRRTRRIVEALESQVTTKRPVIRLILEYYGLQYIPDFLSRLYLENFIALQPIPLLFYQYFPYVLPLLYYFEHRLFTREMLLLLYDWHSRREITKEEKIWITEIFQLSKSAIEKDDRRKKKKSQQKRKART